eukprot:1146814-Pelagomonas_calceolata.AAC.9
MHTTCHTERARAPPPCDIIQCMSPNDYRHVKRSLRQLLKANKLLTLLNLLVPDAGKVIK